MRIYDKNADDWITVLSIIIRCQSRFIVYSKRYLKKYIYITLHIEQRIIVVGFYDFTKRSIFALIKKKKK